MQPLAHAALCRSESDWLVGINATRALTAHNSAAWRVPPDPGRPRPNTDPRHPCPDVEKEIRDSSRAGVLGSVRRLRGVRRPNTGADGFVEEFQKDEADADSPRRASLVGLAEAEAIRDRCKGRTGVVSETRKPAKQMSPLLYDLTSFQREASNRFGFSARRTLQLAQALYEKTQGADLSANGFAPSTGRLSRPPCATSCGVMAQSSRGGAVGNLPPFAARVARWGPHRA